MTTFSGSPTPGPTKAPPSGSYTPPPVTQVTMRIGTEEIEALLQVRLAALARAQQSSDGAAALLARISAEVVGLQTALAESKKAAQIRLTLHA